MRKDGEPKKNLETRFNAVQDEVVKHLQLDHEQNAPEYAGVYMTIVAKKWEGGRSQALILSSNSEWSGKSDMMGWPIGKNPPIGRLIEEYAEITDEEYGRMVLSDFSNDEDGRRKNYIRRSKERLLGGLVNEMEARLEEIKNPQPI